MSKQQNYWNNTGKQEAKAKILQQLIPHEGEISGKENKALDKFRRASNCYYDLFNNGLCNRAKEFAAVFGFGGKAIAEHHRFDMDCPKALLLEEKMDKIVLAAFEEQKPTLEKRLAELAAEQKQVVREKVLGLAAKISSGQETSENDSDWDIAHLHYHTKKFQELKGSINTAGYLVKKEASK